VVKFGPVFLDALDAQARPIQHLPQFDVVDEALMIETGTVALDLGAADEPVGSAAHQKIKPLFQAAYVRRGEDQMAAGFQGPAQFAHQVEVILDVLYAFQRSD
jgi:hypothetical protein